MKQLYSALFSLLFFVFTSRAQNPIVTENALTGNPISEWGVPNFRDTRIAGFSTKMSLNAGETVHFKISVETGATFTLKIYRLGYYGGNGARLIVNLGTLSGVAQPAGISDPATGLLDCGNWSESASWAIPSTAVSGFYIAKIERTGGGSNHIAFVIRNDASNSDLYLQVPDETWQAYNGYGGNSLYDGTTSFPNGHAVKVSYNRPFFPYNSLFSTDGREADWYMNALYPMIRWLERNGYNLTYTSSNDVERNGSRLLNHKVFLSVGHDEYWSKNQRANVEAARNAGVHLAFFSGNEVYWKTRWESAAGNEDRTLVCYKEGVLADSSKEERTCGTKCDVSSAEWTGLWRMGQNYDGGRPENELTGQMSWVEFPSEIGVPATYQKLRFWRNTTITTLAAGQTATLGANTLGFEWDYEQELFAGTYPEGRITMSSKTANSRTHKLSLYRHSSGALVFGAGTVQWAWGLDGNHLGGTTVVSPEMQQATVNLFADMGVQPATLQVGLVAATKSTDVTAPVTTVTVPPNNSAGSVGTNITISGTTTDVGGVVGSVEVSTDGGLTWRPATITAPNATVTWTYTWTPQTQGNIVVKVRGVDDSGNKEIADQEIDVTIGQDVCPCNIFPPGIVPINPLDNDKQGIEVGVKFKASENGFITGIRYYKGAGTTGTHVGSLWTSAGVSLATATFINESESGWQQVLFSTPVAVTAGVTYVASTFSPSGDYTSTTEYFKQAVVNGPLRGLADGEDGPNGVFIYTATPAFPTVDFHKINYWVDVVFTRTSGGQPPTVTTQPVDAAVCAGANVTFSSAATGSPAPTVQWQSTSDGITWTNIPGAISNTLSFVATAADDNNRYRAVWTNAEGPVYSSSALLVLTTPVLTSGLTVTVNSGENVNYVPTSSQQGTVFTWSRAVVNGISNPAATGSGNINESLVNTTNAPIKVIYTYTLDLNGCKNKQDVEVTVNPAQGQGAPCINTTTIVHRFNSKRISAGSYIWFNSSLETLGTSNFRRKDPVTITVTNSRIIFWVHGKKYSLNVPDSRIQFTSSVSTATTSFINNAWETKVPLAFGDDVFMGGLSYKVPVNLPGNMRNIMWTADVSIDQPGFSMKWRWGAAVYSKFADHAGLNIKPVDGLKFNQYQNSDDAGTPENYKLSLTSGATGKRHSKDYTGQQSEEKVVRCNDKKNQFPPIKPVNGPWTQNKLSVFVNPNPSHNTFALRIISKSSDPISVIILDNAGNIMERHDRLNPLGMLRFGDKYKTGVYFAEIRQGDQLSRISVLKL